MEFRRLPSGISNDVLDQLLAKCRGVKSASPAGHLPPAVSSGEQVHDQRYQAASGKQHADRYEGNPSHGITPGQEDAAIKSCRGPACYPVIVILCK